jgi:hypothetical protein
MGDAISELLGAGYRPLPCRWPSTASARRHLERRAHPFPGDRRLLDTRLMKPVARDESASAGPCRLSANDAVVEPGDNARWIETTPKLSPTPVGPPAGSSCSHRSSPDFFPELESGVSRRWPRPIGLGIWLDHEEITAKNIA